MARIVTIVGTRPEIIKMAPVVKALDHLPHENVLVHSGQHHDLTLDRIFFRDMELREPDRQFELREDSPALQVASTMEHVSDVTEDADLVVVHGDTNTTLAGALVAAKQGRRLAHVEAGLRSFDKSMPEEINRIIADRLSDLRFAPTQTSSSNLEREDLGAGVHVVGNSIIDALQLTEGRADAKSRILDNLGLRHGGYALLTFHRAENVDRKERLARALECFEAAADEAGLPILFPIHPRTARRVKEFGLEPSVQALKTLRRIEPTGYLDMLVLEKNASIILTDSGGLQEEACYFHVPCVTLRETTERPETLEIGSNVLAGTDQARVKEAVRKQLAAPRTWPNPFGDGTTAARISETVGSFLG